MYIIACRPLVYLLHHHKAGFSTRVHIKVQYGPLITSCVTHEWPRVIPHLAIYTIALAFVTRGIGHALFTATQYTHTYVATIRKYAPVIKCFYYLFHRLIFSYTSSISSQVSVSSMKANQNGVSTGLFIWHYCINITSVFKWCFFYNNNL